MQPSLDPTDFDPVLKEFDALIGRCEQVQRLLCKDPPAPDAEGATSLQQFGALSIDLRAGAEIPMVHTPKIGRELSRCEAEYFRPALQLAARLLPPSNAAALSRDQSKFVLRKAQDELIYHASLLRQRVRGA